MENKLIKPIVRVGNSAGVILPKEWLNGKAAIELVKKPTNIRRDIFDILDEYLEHILGIYLVGSYARQEESEKSDVDILVITSDIEKEIKKDKYHIILISKKQLEKQLRDNALPILAMINEARAILNDELIEQYKSWKLTRRNIRWHIETTRSALDIVKTSLNMEMVGKAEVYSLILRLRTLYIIDCLYKGKRYSKEGLLKLIKKITGSIKLYEVYEAVKGKEKVKSITRDVEKLYEYVDRKTREWEQWIKQGKRS
ncbi:MAG: nucleotidyltransferase domain-containing protein [Candidatus Nanoarchaeia archaeon]